MPANKTNVQIKYLSLIFNILLVIKPVFLSGLLKRFFPFYYIKIGFVHAVFLFSSVTSHLTHFGFFLLKSHSAVTRPFESSEKNTLPLLSPFVLKAILCAGE